MKLAKFIGHRKFALIVNYSFNITAKIDSDRLALIVSFSGSGSETMLHGNRHHETFFMFVSNRNYE